jgi:3-oxoacyl-[acyl-carrier protein] reductase
MTQQTPSQVMILTGCASGIGRHLVDVLAQRGHYLIATDINLQALQAYAVQAGWNPERVLVHQLDVREAAAWEKIIKLAIDTWGCLDVLINSAAYLMPAYLADATPEHIDQHIDVNVKGLMYGTLAAAQAMIPQRHGHIINFASLAGMAPIPGIGLYSASKYAVRGFSLIAALELREKGIAVTTISPDAVQTPMLDLELQRDEAAITFTAPRILSVEDIGKIVLWVLEKKPLEIAVPRYRGWWAKIAGILPGLATRLHPIFNRQGRAKQQRERTRRQTETATKV